MRIFHFFRHEDQSGVSGTGVVAEGVEFTNGWCALRWMSQQASIAFYQSLNEVRRIHGHGGRTEIVLSEIAPPLRPAEKDPETSQKIELIFAIVDEAAALLALEEDPDALPEHYRLGVQRVRQRLNLLEQKLELGSAPNKTGHNAA